MAIFIETDIVPAVGNPNTSVIYKIYVVDEPHGGTGGGSMAVASFTTIGSQQAYNVPELAGRATSDITNIIMGQTIVAPGSYGLAGTTLTFSGFTVPADKPTVVYFITA